MSDLGSAGAPDLVFVDGGVSLEFDWQDISGKPESLEADEWPPAKAGEVTAPSSQY